MTEHELQAALQISKKIKRRQDRLATLRETGGVGSVSGKELGGGISREVGQIVTELEEEVSDLEKKLEIEKVIIQRHLDNIKALSKTQRQILQLRYLEGLEWKKIQLRLCYSKRHTLRLHREALQTVIHVA